MPLYRKSKFDSGMVLTIWKIEEEEADLRSLLSLNERERLELECIKASTSRLRWMASRLALKSVFDEWKVIEIDKDIHGKPFFQLEIGSFSLSHSGDFAVCVFHPEMKMGVDIEFIRTKVYAIRKKFMKENELESIPQSSYIESLYVCWCAKEAIYKWQGKKGLSMKDGITILPFQYNESGTVDAILSDGERSEDLSIVYERLDGYMMAYVAGSSRS
jgi:4'-phosphopantetheinyl transferase